MSQKFKLNIFKNKNKNKIIIIKKNKSIFFLFGFVHHFQMRHVSLHRWQTLLINGRGQYNCSLAAHYSNSSSSQCRLRGSEQCAPPILHVLPNKIYRLRIASTTALASLNLAIGVSKVKSYVALFLHTSFLTFFSSWAKVGRYILRFPLLCYILLSAKFFFEQKREKFIITTKIHVGSHNRACQT